MNPRIQSRPKFFVLISLLFLMLFGTPVIYAQQVPPAIQAQINAELQKRGLNESEVRTRLLSEGIDLENVPPEQLPAYQKRVTGIMDQMEAEKKALANPASGSNETQLAKPDVIESKTVIVETSQPTTTADKGVTNTTQEAPATKEEAFAVAAERVIQASAEKKEGTAAIYGHSLFTNKTLDIFITTDGALAPDSYILGGGDEIRITIFGASQTDMQLMINNEGYIQPTGMPKIFLQGITLKQARELLYKRLSNAYTFRSDQFALTIVTARTIMVNIFGGTNVTGGFTLSALNSAFNALSAAGGPTEIGSVRTIQLIHGQSKKVLDLYEFMNNPEIQYGFDLQQNDILYVPVVQNLVTIEGAVKRPMRYEMLPDESLADLISFAGGVNVNAYPDFVQIQRYMDGEVKLFEHNLSEVLSGKIKIQLQNGDIVRIKSIEKPIEQYVEISGGVYYPGRYDINANPTLESLLSNAQFTVQARKDLIFIERIRSDETVEVISVPWADLLAKGETFYLEKRDRIQVPILANYRDVANISVNGHVRAPFEKTFALGDRLTVGQALELAGGIKQSAYPIAYIFRDDLSFPGKTEYIRIDLDNSNDFILQPGDKLNVYDNSQYLNVGEVQILGAVKNPRQFTYDPSLTIRDLLTDAGGFTIGAALNNVEVFRTNISPTEKVTLEIIVLEVDSGYQLVRPANFRLQPYDKVIVRQTPAFAMGRMVEVSGEVNYPGAYMLTSKQVHLSELISMAGGLQESADSKGSRLFRTFDNRGYITLDVSEALQNKKQLKFDPYLFAGDVINIDRLENTVFIQSEATRFSNYNGAQGNTTLNVVFQGEKSARWYIKNYAGGFAKRADKKSLIVIKKNSQIMGTSGFLGIHSYPLVETGSTINLKMKPPKPVKEKPEKTDWGKVWGTTLTAVTTALTIFVLAKQL